MEWREMKRIGFMNFEFWRNYERIHGYTDKSNNTKLGKWNDVKWSQLDSTAFPSSEALFFESFSKNWQSKFSKITFLAKTAAIGVWKRVGDAKTDPIIPKIIKLGQMGMYFRYLFFLYNFSEISEVFDIFSKFWLMSYVFLCLCSWKRRYKQISNNFL